MSADGFAAFSEAPSPEELLRFDLNDYGNAMRLIRLSGGAVGADGAIDVAACRLLFLLGVGWVGFNGRYWDRKFGEDLALRTAHKVAVTMRGLYTELVTKVGAKAAMQYLDGCGQSGASTAMLRQAKPYLTVEIAAFDRDPLAVNCRNGTVKLRLREGEDGRRRLVAQLAPHDPADRILRMAEVDFEPGATAPLFEQTVRDSMPVAAEREYLGRVLGYCLTGYTREQAFFIFQGRGRDGKSTILDACREIMGGYGETGSILSFLDAGVRGGSDHSTDIAKLAGDVRLIVLSEPPRGAKLNAGLLKAWTSGSPISARELREKPMTFRPIGKLVIECNPLPDPKGDDDGIWRRIKPILFRKQVPEDKVDKSLPEKLRAEAAGILNWLIAGVEDWLCGGEDGAGGLREPEGLRQVLEDYRKAASPISDWLNQCCVWGEAAAGERTLTKELYDSFKTWCDDQGIEKPMSVRAFGDALRDRQVMLAGKNAKGLKYRGPIRLKTELELREEAEAAERLAALARAVEAGSSAGGPEGSEGYELPADDGPDDDGDGGFGL